MPELDDLGGYLSPTLDLPVAGKVYKVPSPPARVGLRLQASWAVTNAQKAGITPREHHLTVLARDTGTSLEQDALGPVHDEMLADGVSIDLLNHAGMAAYLWIVAGEKAARLWWVTPLGEASTPLPEPTTTSTSTGEASTTPTPASTSTTRSRPSSGSDESSAPTA